MKILIFSPSWISLILKNHVNNVVLLFLYPAYKAIHTYKDFICMFYKDTTYTFMKAI